MKDQDKTRRRTGSAAVSVGVGLLALILLGQWWNTKPTAGSLDRPSAPRAAPTIDQPAAEGAVVTSPAAPTTLVPPFSVRPATPDPPSETPTYRLHIPAVEVDAPVLPVGVRADGAMEVPEPGDRLGWYRFGPAPGSSRGTVVLTGHVATYGTGPGALIRLSEVPIGTTVTLIGAGDHRYVVRGRARFDKQQLPVAQLFDRSGPARLTIITCGGRYLPDRKQYEANDVVVADPL